MYEYEKAQRISYVANAVLMSYVFLMIFVYWYYGVTYMVYHSIPTLGMYFFFFYMIHRRWLAGYVRLVYVVITIYMAAATVCLGYNYGFHLYCFSLIPIIFYSEYIAYQIHGNKVSAMLISLWIVCVYLVSNGYVILYGPRYTTDQKAALFFLVINSLSVFTFLIGYTSVLRNMVISAQEKLSQMAMLDELTGLYNRHYMEEHLEKTLEDVNGKSWLAMIDIDDFKKFNDTYGHNGGDYVLVSIASMMREQCKNGTVSRWGGEEFLIIGSGKDDPVKLLEELRKKISETKFQFEGRTFHVTVTLGCSFYEKGRSLDSWIRDADAKLYYGKSHGKNQVVHKI